MTAFATSTATRQSSSGPAPLDIAADLVGEGYTLLTTARAAKTAPAVADRAAAVVEVPPGAVDEIAAQMRDGIGMARLVALGGGRVIDTAKAITRRDSSRPGDDPDCTWKGWLSFSGPPRSSQNWWAASGSS